MRLSACAAAAVAHTCAHTCAHIGLTLAFPRLSPSGESRNRLLELVRQGIDGRPTASVVELEWPNYYYFGKEGQMVHAAEADEWTELAAMHAAFEELGEEGAARTLPEQSLLQFFASRGLSSRVLDLADAIFANDYGADASDVGLVRQPVSRSAHTSLASLSRCG